MVGSAWPRHLLQCALSCEARHVRGALWGRLHGQGTPTAGCASRFVWLQEARCPRASPDSPPAAAPGPVSRLTPSTGPSGPPVSSRNPQESSWASGSCKGVCRLCLPRSPPTPAPWRRRCQQGSQRAVLPAGSLRECAQPGCVSELGRPSAGQQIGCADVTLLTLILKFLRPKRFP